MGSPPPDGSKKAVLKLRSVNSIVMAAARTGNESNNKKAVIITAHTKSGTKPMRIPGTRMFNTVTIKLIAPKMEDNPAKCKLKITKSTAPPL